MLGVIEDLLVHAAVLPDDEHHQRRSHVDQFHPDDLLLRGARRHREPRVLREPAEELRRAFEDLLQVDDRLGEVRGDLAPLPLAELAADGQRVHVVAIADVGGIRPALVCGCERYPSSSSAAISLRIVALETPSPACSATASEPTGSPGARRTPRPHAAPRPCGLPVRDGCPSCTDATSTLRPGVLMPERRCGRVNPWDASRVERA